MLTDFLKSYGTPVTDSAFGSLAQFLPSVQPYRAPGEEANAAWVDQSRNLGGPIAEPDLGAARSRSLDGLGPLLAFVPFFLASKNKKRGLAAFARALGQSLQQNRREQTALETWRAEQINRRRQQEYEMAMAQVKDGRTLLEKALSLDPELAGRPEFQQAWLSGDPTFLAQSGWRPPAKEPARDKYPTREIGGRVVMYDPYTGDTVRDLGPSGGPKEPKEPSRADAVDAAWRKYHELVETLGDPQKAWLALPVDDKALIRRDPSKLDILDILLSRAGSEGGGLGIFDDPRKIVEPDPGPEPVPTKKKIPNGVYQSMIQDAMSAGNEELVLEIQETYEPIS